jgi:uncharacterized protein with HEPN domain
MKRDDSVYLRHILDAMARLAGYLDGVNEPTFLAQPLLQDGAIRQIEVMGEAVKNLSQSLRENHSHLPWQDIAGMRDKLIHQYFGVDLEKVWLTAVRDIPALQPEIANILASLPATHS